MTFNYKNLSRKPVLFKTFAGFTQDEFDRIFKKINEGYETYEKWRLNRKDKKRADVAGRKFKLVLRERFLISTNTECLEPQNQDFAGFLFIIVFTLPVHQWGFSLIWTRAQSGEISDISDLL